MYSPDEDRKYSFASRDEAEERVRTGIAQGKLSFFLRGEKLKGSFALVRTKVAGQWPLIKHKDPLVSETDVLLQDRSVVSAFSLDDLSSGNSPARQDATRLVPSGPFESMPG